MITRLQTPAQYPPTLKNCNAQVSIIVNKGSFASVQQAAAGEDEVNFCDENPTGYRACTESFAATELASFLVKATDIKKDDIRFVDNGILPDNGDVFIIGSRSTNPLLTKYNHLDDTRFDTEEAYSIRSFNENGRVITVIEGADRVGSLYGTYRYLNELGIKFIGLGEQGTIYPIAPTKIISGININENPSYHTRGFHAWGDRKGKVDNDFFLWMARNKLNYWTAEGPPPIKLLKKLGMKLYAGGHRIQGEVFDGDNEYPYNHHVFKGNENKPEDPYEVGSEYAGDLNNDGRLSNFEAHPEWYGMKDGKRMKIVLSPDVTGDQINFCTSNEDGRKEFSKRIVRELIDGKWKHVDVFNVWMLDVVAESWCTCDKCMKAGSYTDKMFTVTYDILKELEKAHKNTSLNRRIEIGCLAYLPTLHPPTKPLPDDYDYENSSVTFFPIRRCYVHSFADPACTEINQWQLQAFQGWTVGEKRFYKGSIFIGEYYNVSRLMSLPGLFTKIMAVDIPWYYRSGALHFHYMHTPHRLWGTWTLNNYLMGKLLWNINDDALTILDDYFRSYYPTTSETTRRFYEQLEIATANIKLLKATVGMAPDVDYYLNSRLLNGNLFELDHMHYDEFHPLVNDGPDVVQMIDAMEKAKAYLKQSLINCKEPAEKERLLEDRIRFDYGYAMYQYIFHMIRTSVFHKESDKKMAVIEFALVKKYAEQLRNMVDVVQSSSIHANAVNGLEATESVDVFNEFLKLYEK